MFFGVPNYRNSPAKMGSKFQHKFEQKNVKKRSKRDKFSSIMKEICDNWGQKHETRKSVFFSLFFTFLGYQIIAILQLKWGVLEKVKKSEKK